MYLVFVGQTIVNVLFSEVHLVPHKILLGKSLTILKIFKNLEISYSDPESCQVFSKY